MTPLEGLSGHETAVSRRAVRGIPQTTAQEQPETDQQGEAVAQPIAKPHKVSSEVRLLQAQDDKVQVNGQRNCPHHSRDTEIHGEKGLSGTQVLFDGSVPGAYVVREVAAFFKGAVEVHDRSYEIAHHLANVADGEMNQDVSCPGAVFFVAEVG